MQRNRFYRSFLFPLYQRSERNKITSCLCDPAERCFICYVELLIHISSIKRGNIKCT